MSSSSSSASKICFNSDCKETKSEQWRKGWRLRTGEFAELCDRCSAAFEEVRFCEVFHSDLAGWRKCESCGKRVHCGCIASVHTFLLLDTGGVECMPCAKKSFYMASNQMWPSSFFLPVTLPERLKDLSVKNWNQFTASASVPGQWRPPPNLWNPASGQSELHSRMPYEVDRPNTVDSMVVGDHICASSHEKKKIEDPSDRIKIAALDRLANGNIVLDTLNPLNSFHREEGIADGLRDSRRLTGENGPADMRKGVVSEAGLANSVPGINFETHPSSSASISMQSSAPKDDPSAPHFGVPVSFPLSNGTDDLSKVSGHLPQHQVTPPSLAKQFYGGSNNGMELSSEPQNQIRNGRLRAEARGRNQLLPRYWPRITDQELQQISGDSNSVITPLFEKMLSASDAGRIGRLVLPKKCAEAYFPSISQPEGLPLKVQDAKGKEWVFQFRFWPNNNSRMYVLEGVTPCIQSMQLQAGDTVTFSRMEPEGKLVMGFRKASSTPAEQDAHAHKNGNTISVSGKNDAWAKPGKAGSVPKEGAGSKSSLSNKRKTSTIGSKSKRLRINNEDAMVLKLTWEEAQGLLRPPTKLEPSIVVIEGHEFEEYEEPPVLGKPTFFTTTPSGKKIQWVQCDSCSKWRKLPADALVPAEWHCSLNSSFDGERARCDAAQELTTEQLEGLISSNTAPLKKKKVKEESDGAEASEGLDTLANVAILGEGGSFPPSGQATTRHPRHRPGCTCIVCIQPPSGKGPKHKQSCTCNVCLTVKRRFRTLMLRREKRQSEKEAETTRKKQIIKLPEKQEQEHEEEEPSNIRVDNVTVSSKITEGVNEDLRNEATSSPLKGQIDLNIQPEREEESSPVSDSGSMLRLLQDATDMYFRHQRSVDLNGNRDSVATQIEPVVSVKEKPIEGGSKLDEERDAVVSISMSMLASTPATG
ncbi:B3 domain-containing protein Os07g0563300-like isoform X2 [Aristolochia californica]|uniref:B3 domain-containing protein Os07g0563300-like isoform X2 n=1 Tax=Aristolochia californica TaxID=171875 RepID=UPI0035E1854D